MSIELVMHEIAFSEGKRGRSFFQVAVSGWEKQRNGYIVILHCIIFFCSAYYVLEHLQNTYVILYNHASNTMK